MTYSMIYYNIIYSFQPDCGQLFTYAWKAQSGYIWFSLSSFEVLCLPSLLIRCIFNVFTFVNWC